MLVIFNRVGYFNFYFLLCSMQEITSAETSRYVEVHDVGNSKKHTVKTLN